MLYVNDWYSYDDFNRPTGSICAGINLNTTQYDDYDGISGFAYEADMGFTPESPKTDDVLTLPTKIVTGMFDVNGSAGSLTSVMYYDDRGRLLQTISDNHLGGKDIVSNKYHGLTQQIDVMRHVHDIGGDTIVTDYYYQYDHRGRLISTTMEVDSLDPVMVTANEYNERGEVIKQLLHSENNSNFTQEIGMVYNTKGWLLFKNAYNPNPDANSVMNIGLNYDGYFNGNISQLTWGSENLSGLVYDFAYDPLNRLLTADFTGADDDGPFATDAFKTGYEYDKNGNITGLHRFNRDGFQIDDLKYTFLNKNSNQYETIGDMASEDYSFYGYNAVAQPQGNMTYDGNGNLTTEPNKGLTIDYNVLNLPLKITRQVDEESRTIDYLYSGDGTKLQRRTNDDGEDVLTDYVGNFVYEQEAGQRSLKYLITPAGRLLHDSIGNWQWQYNISDHLGNTRAVIFPDYENNVVTEQETHYYPFGLSMGNMGKTPDPRYKDNLYLYNGKELQTDLDLGWYDYGARFYEPAIGRWHTLDPLAEKEISISPYVYVANNPIIYIDPDGEFKTKFKAKYWRKQAIKRRWGKNRVSDLYYNDAKSEWAFMVYDQGKDNSTWVESGGDGGSITVKAYRGKGVYDKKGLRKASWEQNEVPLGNGLDNVITLTPEINDFWQAVGEGFQDPLGIPFSKAGVFTIFYNWAEKRRNKYQERKKNGTRENIENEESRMKKMNSLAPEPLCIGCYGEDPPAGLKPIRENDQ